MLEMHPKEGTRRFCGRANADSSSLYGEESLEPSVNPISKEAFQISDRMPSNKAEPSADEEGHSTRKRFWVPKSDCGEGDNNTSNFSSRTSKKSPEIRQSTEDRGAASCSFRATAPRSFRMVTAHGSGKSASMSAIRRSSASESFLRRSSTLSIQHKSPFLEAQRRESFRRQQLEPDGLGEESQDVKQSAMPQYSPALRLGERTKTPIKIVERKKIASNRLTIVRQPLHPQLPPRPPLFRRFRQWTRRSQPSALGSRKRELALFALACAYAEAGPAARSWMPIGDGIGEHRQLKKSIPGGRLLKFLLLLLFAAIFALILAFCGIVIGAILGRGVVVLSLADGANTIVSATDVELIQHEQSYPPYRELANEISAAAVYLRSTGTENLIESRWGSRSALCDRYYNDSSLNPLFLAFSLFLRGKGDAVNLTFTSAKEKKGKRALGARTPIFGTPNSFIEYLFQHVMGPPLAGVRTLGGGSDEIGQLKLSLNIRAKVFNRSYLPTVLIEGVAGLIWLQPKGEALENLSDSIAVTTSDTTKNPPSEHRTSMDSITPIRCIGRSVIDARTGEPAFATGTEPFEIHSVTADMRHFYPYKHAFRFIVLAETQLAEDGSKLPRGVHRLEEQQLSLDLSFRKAMHRKEDILDESEGWRLWNELVKECQRAHSLAFMLYGRKFLTASWIFHFEQMPALSSPFALPCRTITAA